MRITQRLQKIDKYTWPVIICTAIVIAMTFYLYYWLYALIWLVVFASCFYLGHYLQKKKLDDLSNGFIGVGGAIFMTGPFLLMMTLLP